MKNDGEAEDGYYLLTENDSGKIYAYPMYIANIYFTFKSEDTDKNEAYFYATAPAGYYIKDGQAVALPYYISGNEFEINPDTDYWRCK